MRLMKKYRRKKINKCIYESKFPDTDVFRNTKYHGYIGMKVCEIRNIFIDDSDCKNCDDKKESDEEITG